MARLLSNLLSARFSQIGSIKTEKKTGYLNHTKFYDNYLLRFFDIWTQTLVRFDRSKLAIPNSLTIQY